MPTNRLSIATMGLGPYLDASANIHGGHNAAWFEVAVRQWETGEIPKREIYEAMKITSVTLDKYILLLRIDKAQQYMATHPNGQKGRSSHAA